MNGMPVRFRAAAALELRRREEESAAIALARAEAERQAALTAWSAADQQRRQALAAQAAQVDRGIDAAVLFWHRNWIHRLRGTVDELAVELQRRTVALESQRRAWQLARRRRLALERLKERAWRRFQADDRRRERLVIDELARLRFLQADAGQGEHADGG